MDCSILTLLIIITTNIVYCDWVEITQSEISLNTEKESKIPDLDMTSYILTTTSTTVQTPILAKPTNIANKKSQISNIHKSVSASIKGNKTSNVTNIRAISLASQPLNKTKAILNVHKSSNVTTSTTSHKNNSDAEQVDDDYYDEDEDDAVQKDNDENGYTYTSFIPYMSIIQSTLMKNAHKNKKSKVHVLRNLRDHLLGEIGNRMSSLWQPKVKTRGAREYKDDSHVDFPSNEGALMTIGFLTFAVFLIKLVLQLIQTLSNKMDDNNGTTTTFAGRKRRSALIDEEATKILSYIDQYPLK